MTINCPICKKTISDAPDDWEFRPFCSSRCKLVDLSNWLDERYRYNMIPFQPQRMSPEELQRGCLEARRAFYSVPSILRRSVDKVNRPDFFMWRHFFLINGMIRAEVSARDYYPLGDASWQGRLVKAQ